MKNKFETVVFVRGAAGLVIVLFGTPGTLVADDHPPHMPTQWRTGSCEDNQRLVSRMVKEPEQPKNQKPAMMGNSHKRQMSGPVC